MITYPSYTFEPIDGWFQYEEFDQRLFDESLVPFAGTSNIGNEMTGVYCGNANLMTDDLCMKESMELDFNHILFEENFVQEQNQPSSSLSSKLTPSIDSSDNSSTRIFRSNSISSTSVSAGSKTSILQPGNRSLSCSIPNSSDDAITKAMVAVISSVSSASSSSSPSIISHNSPKFGENAKAGAFRPFIKSDFSPKYEINVANDGQNLIKRSLAMLKSIKPVVEKQETKPSNLHHMISERRRREKLNTSFDMLRMLLPPGSKKDKTSVLIKAASYLKSVESQISELQDKNHKLESYLPNATGGKDTIGSNERVQIQILRTGCHEPQVHQINLRINVVQECDIVELVLRMLDCLKSMESVSLVSVDAYTFSPHMKLHAKASIKFRIKESNWNEALFRQAIEKAADDVTQNTYTRSICPKPSRLH